MMRGILASWLECEKSITFDFRAVRRPSNDPLRPSAWFEIVSYHGKYVFCTDLTDEKSWFAIIAD
jgi:hypothetical protein